MNISEIINGDGTMMIPNPNYNPRAKKNKQPKYISVPNVQTQTDPFLRMARQDAYTQTSINAKEAEKYNKYGLNWSPNRNMDAELAEAQSNWTKLGNALAQTVVDEFIGGTIQSFADMAVAMPQALAKITDTVLEKVFDVEGDKVQNALGMRDEDYSNPVSDKIEEWREKFRNEVAPIYTTPGVDIGNGGFSDFGWWMQNMPSIMSSITLLIPTRAATVGISKLAGLARKANTARKATRAINKAVQAERVADAAKLGEVSRDFEELNSIQRFFNNPITRERIAKGARDFAEAGIMRTIENYQEAHQAYQDMYAQAGEILGGMSDEDYAKWLQTHGKEFEEDGVDTTDKDAVAKHIATKAADRTFAADYTNMVFDFIQLHSLRDVGRIAKNTTSPSIKRMHRLSKEIAGKTDAQIKDIAKKSIGTQIREGLTDFTTGAAKTILSEASEGVEEGINYIAQQEGITYGNTLLSLEKDSTKGGFWNTRLSDYLDDSEFWESAFWGVAGGVVFGEGMNAITKGQIARANKKKEKERAANETTGEQTVTSTSENVLNDFIAQGELPEVKAAKEAITRRATRANQLAQDLKAIEEGRNPNILDPKTGQPTELGNDPVSKELAKLELIHQFRTELAFDALNSGTYDLLIDYLKNDNVKKMFVDMGATTNEEMNKFISETIKDMEVAKTAYNSELAHVNHQVTAMNANKPEEGKIPLEYVQHIARINATKRVKIAGLERQINALEAKRAELDPDGTEYAGNAVDAKSAVRLAMLMDTFGRLDADKRALEADDEIEPWAKAESLKEIKNQQDAILNSIVETSTGIYGTVPFNLGTVDEPYNPSEREHALGAALKTIRMAKAYERVGDIYRSNESSEEYQKTDEELMKEYDHVFSKSKSNASILGQIAQLVEQDLNDVAGTGRDSLYNTNKRLYDLYTNLADLEIQRGVLKSQVTRSQSQIQEHVDIIHNRLNNVRREKLKRAEKAIRDIHTKYMGTNAKDVEMTIISAYMNNREEAVRLARENLTGVDEDGHSDAEKLLDALAILNFSSSANQDAFTYIMSVLRRNALKHKDLGEGYTTFQNPQPAPQNGQTNNPSAEQGNTLFGQPAPQNGNVNGQQTIVTAETIDDDPRPKQDVIVSIEGDRVVIQPVTPQEGTVTLGTVTLLDNGNGEFELAISALPKEQQARYILEPKLFGEINADALNPGIELTVSSNPVVVYDTFNKPVLDTLGGVIATNAETGEVIDTTSSPVEEDDAEPAAPETPTTPTPEPETTQPAPSTTQQGGTNAPISSTGEESEHMSPAQQEAVIGHIIGEYIAANNLDIENITDWDGLYNNIIQAIQPGIEAGNFTLNEIEPLIVEYLEDLRQDNQELQSLEGNDRNAGRIAMYARYEEPNTRDISGLFKASVEAFIEEYGKHFIVKEVNGKPAIRIRDIMNACNQLKKTTDNANVDNLYNVVVAYLMSEEGQEKYTVLDANDVVNGTVMDKVGKTAAELRAASGTTTISTNDIKLDITDIISRGDAAAFRTLNALKAGDKLNVNYIHRGSGVIEFTASDGTIIGTLHIPYVSDPRKTNGIQYFNYHTDDWIMNVGVNAQGQPVGPLYDLFQDIFFNPAPQYDDIRQIILQYQSTRNKVQCGNLLAQNPVIQQVVQDSIAAVSQNRYGENLVYINNRTNQTTPNEYGNLVEGLYKVWAYTFENGGNIQDMRDNLEDWFLKTYNTYKATYEAAKNIANVEAEVVYNPDGEINLVVPANEQNRDDAYDKMPTVEEAVADPSRAFVAIADRDQSLGLRLITANDQVNPQPTQNWSNNSTLLAVMGNSGKPHFVKAFGVRLNDINVSNETKENFKNILDPYYRIVNSYIEAIANADTQAKAEQARIKLMEFLRDTIAGQRMGLFRAIDGQIIVQDVVYKNSPNIRGIEISWQRRDGSTHSFQITTTDRNGTPKLGVKTLTGKLTTTSSVGQVTNDLIYGFIGNNFQFDISKEGIIADAGIRGQQRNSVFRRTPDGKFVVTLKHPSTGEILFQETYNSYSDFLIKNNMLRVNTKKAKNRGTDSNFSATSRNQRGNQMVMVRLSTKTQVPSSSATAQITQSTIVSQDADEETFERVKAILPDRSAVVGKRNVDLTDKTGKASDIIQAVMGVTALDELNQVAREMGIDVNLFPDKIMYDPYFNRNTGDEAGDGFIAATNPDSVNHKYTQYGKNGNRVWLRPGWVVVGNKLLNMLSSTSKERRNRGITKLIHERLHQIINDKNLTPEKREAFDAVKEVYQLYKTQLDSDIAAARTANQVVRLNALETLDRLLKNVTRDIANHPEREDEIYEEFIVEAMTNNLMYEYLNRVKYVPGSNAVLDRYTNDSGKETLFTKIMDLIARIFGWNRRNEGSLNEKLYQILRTLGNTDHIEPESSDTVLDEGSTEEDEVEPETDEQIDEQVGIAEAKQASESLDVDDDDDYDDLDYSSEEEVSADDLNNPITGLDVIKQNIPAELRPNFDNLVKNGYIELICK